MSDLSWYQIVDRINADAIEVILSGEIGLDDDDAQSEYAWSQADSSSYVIYTYESRQLWADSSDVQGYEADADEMGPFDSIDKWIQVTVFEALRAAWSEGFSRAREEIRQCDECGRIGLCIEDNWCLVWPSCETCATDCEGTECQTSNSELTETV